MGRTDKYSAQITFPVPFLDIPTNLCRDVFLLLIVLCLLIDFCIRLSY